MSELRWTLLILGVVFIAVLSWWERRRPRQAFSPRLRDAGLGHGGEIHTHEAAGGDGKRTTPVPREPWIGDAELADVDLSDVRLAEEPAAERVPEPLKDLPTLIIADEDERLELTAAWDSAPPEPTLFDPEADEPLAAPAEAPAPQQKPEPPRASQPPRASEPTLTQTPAPEPTPTPEPSEAARPAAAAVRPTPPAAVRPTSPEPDMEREIPGAEGVGAVRIVERAEPDGEAAAAVEPIVDWPPEDSRRIVALRVVARPSERFAGRTLRLALAAEGFLLGKFSIFHKPDESNRAVLSAASLTRPGAFDPDTMDSQRFAGINLFAVLPGPKPPAQAFEELLATARNLNERLEGALQDERGGPLTVLRVQSIRESVRGDPSRPSATAAHGT